MNHESDREPKLLYSVPEAATALGIGRTMVYKLMANGQLTPVHVGRLTRFTKLELERFVDELSTCGRQPDDTRRSA